MKKAPQANGSTHPQISRSGNSRLHIALGAALIVASLVALGIPITRTQASSERGSEQAVVADAGHGLSDALRVQATSVTAALGLSVAPASSAQADRLSALESPFIPDALMGAVGRIVAGSVFHSPEVQAAMVIQRQHPASFTVHDGGYAASHFSSQMTVGQALAGVGVQIDEHALVSPPTSSALVPGTHIYVRHAVNARLFVAGAEREVFTHATTVAGMLTEAGVTLGALDRVSPRAATVVRGGMRVSVTTVRDAGEVVEEEIAFDTVYRYDSELLKGRELLDQAGSNGMIRREYQMRLINGREVQRQLVSETVTSPTDEIITIGTYVRPVPTPAPIIVSAPAGDLACSRTLNVYATWYTAASAGGGGTTATGTGVYKGIVAVDPRVIPLGTRMYIPGYGYGLAADTGGGIIGNMIDLGYGADDAKDWRTHRVDICIL
jgi:uncharacterized protein YabE (DUF348 family)/3D (Asp-Asp-Asp) domain-containing protein